MTLKESIQLAKKHFALEELVGKPVFERYGEQAWTFFDPRMLETLYVIRHDILGFPLVVNNWKSGGKLSQRGLRSNMDEMILAKAQVYLNAKNKGVQGAALEKVLKENLYETGHMLGNAIDFSSGKMTADEMRKVIVAKKDLLPYPIRLEGHSGAPTWVHFDMENATDSKIQMFLV